MKITLTILAILAFIVILVTATWGFVSLNIFPNTALGLYNKSFFENLLVEIHGTIFDIFVVAVILFWFEKRQETKNRINEANETLDYLKNYQGDDASYKFYGMLKKLLALGENKIKIPDGKLNKLKIDSINLDSSNLIAVDFSDSNISNCSFVRCNAEASRFFNVQINHTKLQYVNLQRTKFNNARLKGMDFRTCDIRFADFNGALLQSADFRGVDCEGVNFKNANLRSANFKGAKNLTMKMLQLAKDTNYVKLSDDIVE